MSRRRICHFLTDATYHDSVHEIAPTPVVDLRYDVSQWEVAFQHELAVIIIDNGKMQLLSGYLFLSDSDLPRRYI